MWSPHGHHEAVEALLGIAQVVLLDSVDEPDIADALMRARMLLDRVYVVDLAWLRSTPWRERMAATFDPPQPAPRAAHAQRGDRAPPARLGGGRAAARRLAGVATGLARRARSSRATARLAGSAHARRQDVSIELQPVRDMQVRGLAGLTVETASGRSLSLDRGPGGLQARYRNAKGDERRWTVLGASRGEAGILGEGIPPGAAARPHLQARARRGVGVGVLSRRGIDSRRHETGRW